MKINKAKTSQFTSLVIGILLIAMIAMMCMPYFNYGDAASNYTAVAGNDALLMGKWVTGDDPSADGYKEIEFGTDGKTMTVKTTNIIRVYQNAADTAVTEALKTYEAAKAAVEVTDVANQKVQAYAKVLADAKAYIDAFGESNVKVDGLSFKYFQSEVEGLTVEVPADAPVVLDAAAIEAIKTDAGKSYTKLEKHIKDAQDNYDEAVAALETAKAAVETAVAGAAKAYEADASIAYVTEDQDKFVAAFSEANPEIAELIKAKNEADYNAYIAADEAYKAALAKTEEAKAKYDELKKTADAKIEAEANAKKEAEANAEAILKEMKAENDKASKELKAQTTKIGEDYVAAIAAINEGINAIVEEYNTASEGDAKVYNSKIEEYKAAQAAAVAEAKAKYEADIAANTAAIEKLKVDYDAAVAAQKAADEAAIAAATAAYEAAVKTVENEYLAAKNEYQSLKKTSDALKKAIPSKVALYEEADILEGVETIAMAAEISEEELELLGADFETSKEALDNKVYDKLAAEKAKAAEGYNLSKNVVKETEKLYKAADKLTKSNGKEANKPVDNFTKEFAKYVAFVASLNAEKTFELPAVEAVASEIAAYEPAAYEKTSDEPEMIETVGSYKFDKKKNEVKLTFKNGEVITTGYSTEFGYDGVQELSILGYVGFPYKVESFTGEMCYKLFGYNINDVVLVPIVLLVLAVLGAVFCYLKRGKMSAAYLPAAFGIVGLIGYATSDFLKLGVKYSNHMIGFAVVLALAAIHIFITLKDKKAK